MVFKVINVKNELKNPLGKTTKSINFDNIVLDAIKKRAVSTGSKESTLVNFLCRRVLLNDIEFNKEMEKYHRMKAEEFRFYKENAQIIVESK